MNTVAISQITTDLTQSQIEESIERLIGQYSLGISDNIFLSIADLVGQIDEIDFLLHIVGRLREACILSQKKIGRLEIDEYGEVEKAKILASVYSLHLAYAHYWILNGSLNSQITEEYFDSFGLVKDLPKLFINIVDGLIQFNLFEIVDFIQRKVTIADRVYADALPEVDRTAFIKKSISNLNNLSFIKRHGLYKTQMDYWVTVLETPSSSRREMTVDVAQRDYYPFTNYGRELFEYLMAEDIRRGRGKQADIAYYYWRLHNDKFVRGPQKDFKAWVEESYGLENPLGKFRALIYLQDEDRNNKYVSAVKWLNASYQID